MFGVHQTCVCVSDFMITQYNQLVGIVANEVDKSWMPLKERKCTTSIFELTQDDKGIARRSKL
jgi:hypothetical protein